MTYRARTFHGQARILDAHLGRLWIQLTRLLARLLTWASR